MSGEKMFAYTMTWDLPRNWEPNGLYIHFDLVHKRTVRMHKRAGQHHFPLEHIPFDFKNKYGTNIALEHKTQFAGAIKLRIWYQDME